MSRNTNRHSYSPYTGKPYIYHAGVQYAPSYENDLVEEDGERSIIRSSQFYIPPPVDYQSPAPRKALPPRQVAPSLQAVWKDVGPWERPSQSFRRYGRTRPVPQQPQNQYVRGQPQPPLPAPTPAPGFWQSLWEDIKFWEDDRQQPIAPAVPPTPPMGPPLPPAPRQVGVDDPCYWAKGRWNKGQWDNVESEWVDDDNGAWAEAMRKDNLFMRYAALSGQYGQCLYQ